MTPPDDSVAVCYLVSRRMIPVVFVPGVMGSNLLGLRPRRRFNGSIELTKEPVWLLDSMADAATWIPVGAEFRKIMLDPGTTSVYGGGKLPAGTSLTADEMRRRGWGEVAHISYGGFLAWLENALNDTHDFLTGVRSQLMEPSTVQRVKFRDGDKVIGLPNTDPYDEIYIKRGKWWCLCDDKLINPADKKKEMLYRRPLPDACRLRFLSENDRARTTSHPGIDYPARPAMRGALSHRYAGAS